MTYIPQITTSYERELAGWLQVHKFGENPSIATADDPEDVWSVGGTITVANVFPSTAQSGTVVVNAAADDVAGTGAQTVFVSGIASDGSVQTETVNTDGAGTSSTALANTYKAINRAYVASAGTGETNAAAIQIKLNGNTCAEIPAGYGQTQQAIYTVPTGYTKYYITRWNVRIISLVASQEATFYLVRRTGGVVRFQDKTTTAADGSSAVEHDLDNWIEVSAGDNIWVRCQEVSGTIAVAATFDLVGIP